MTAVKPAEALPDQVWLVTYDGVPHLGARAVPGGRAPWRVGRLDLSRVACVPDDEVTLVRRLLPLDDLPPAPVATLPDEVPASAQEHAVLAVESQTARLADEVADLVDLLRIGMQIDLGQHMPEAAKARLHRFDAARRARQETRDV